MLKIGEFARLAQVSVRLLHHYDKLGLLSPAQVDRSTGYRYYAVDQLQRLHRILALKDLGLSLEQIGDLLANSLSTDELRGMLLLKQAELRQRVVEEQVRLDRVEQRLRAIEQADAARDLLPEIDVVIKPVPEVSVMSLRRAVDKRRSPHYVFYEASEALRAHGLREAVEAIMCRYYTRFMMQIYDFGKPRRNLVEAAYVIGPALAQEITTAQGGHLRPRVFPAVELMACVIHCGADSQRHLAHQALLRWTSAHGYALAAPTREIYVWRGEPDETSDQHVTEIQHPIRKLDVEENRTP